MMFCVYKIKNLVNGKLYIGKTCNPDERWHDHLTAAKYKKDSCPIHRAINKYGEDNFEFSIIEEYESDEKALSGEVFWIAEHKTNISKYGNQFGYNLTDGGEGVAGLIHTEESKRKMSEAVMGEKNHNYGKPKSDEIKRKISDSNKGQKRTPETKAKISAVQLGKEISENTKSKMSAAHTGKHVGENNNSAKLTENDVREIKILLSGGVSTWDIALKYNVKERAIRNIRAGRSWSHIK